ncbi:Fic family protein [Halovivax cerinus]|uniref:Fic family protein n=1 Tax=Halovivax cerinus TaxID=1487865 RepID=A0ABD5NQK0_9EURY|nr:Fic family protein [Halovivax cerinus]
MDRDQFTEAAPGTLVTTTANGYETPSFVPDSLADVDVDQGELVAEIGQAMRMLGALDYLGPKAGSHTMIIEAFARKEAIYSSRIEGTQVTLSDVYRYEAQRAIGEASGDTEGARQATNYLAALELGLEAIADDERITVDTLCEMQGVLLDDVRSEDPAPGSLRRRQNYLAPFESADIRQATFVPPPPDEVTDLLERLLAYTNDRAAVHSLVTLGLIHYQFETIHPFRDGNGRLGRLLVSLELQREGLLSDPYLYLSAYFNEYRRDYTDLLTRVRTDGAWDEWLGFFIRGIWEQAREGVRRGEALLDLRREYVERYQSHRSDYILPLTQSLFSNPYITPKGATQAFEFSHTTAYSLIETLEADGVLTPVESAGQHQLYQASEIFAHLERPIADLPTVDGDVSKRL